MDEPWDTWAMFICFFFEAVGSSAEHQRVEFIPYTYYEGRMLSPFQYPLCHETNVRWDHEPHASEMQQYIHMQPSVTCMWPGWGVVIPSFLLAGTEMQGRVRECQ